MGIRFFNLPKLICLLTLGGLFASGVEAASGRSCAGHLSHTEILQLGKKKPLERGGFSPYRYPTQAEWNSLRKILVERSVKANPLLDPHYTAYTPGETLWLMNQPQVRDWHRRIKKFKVPRWVETIVFVPCAKTKPWHTARRGLYKSYNEIRKLRDQGKASRIYFVTISEPLGVVPEAWWGSFPQYDNPGLFKEEAMRSGLFTSDWPKIGFKSKRVVPFDEEAYETAVMKLGVVIGEFIKTNKNKRFISFVGGLGEVTSHDDMILAAEDHADVESLLSEPIQKHSRRPAPRQPPRDHILKNIP